MAEVFVIAPHPAAVVLVAAVLWVALPGIALVRAMGEVPPAAAYLLGPSVGFGVSVIGMFLFWAAGVQNWFTVMLGPLLTWAVAAVLRHFGGVRLRWPSFDRRDLMAVVIALAVVPLITWAPYAHVRDTVAEGEAYRAYFTADFIWAMTVTTELEKGEVPPLNPFLHSGSTLNYYWMAHFLSGTLYHNVRAWGVSAESVILIDGLAFGLAFVALLYGLARLAGSSPAFAALAVVVGFCANSYEGANRIWILGQAGMPWELLKDYNIDAVTRWFYQGMPVDGLQRLLLYQPHHLTGYVMGLTALWLVALADDVTEITVALCAGILLALAFLFSTFTAVMLSVAMGVLYACRLIERRASWRALITCAVLGGGPAIVGALMTRVLGYTDPAAVNLIRVGLNPVAVQRWPLMLFLSFGPLLFAGGLGMLRLGWLRREGAAAGAIVVTAFAFYFFVDVPDMEGVWVGWRSGHQLLIAFAVAGAAALTAAWRWTPARLPVVGVILLACVPATPTVAIDVFNAQDIWNRDAGPNFPWTLIITPGEREALEWVKGETAIDAVVQVEPVARGATYWAYIPALGERRMAAGLPGAMIPFRKFQEASETVRLGIFGALSARDAHKMARALEIDYLWIGDVERRHYAPAIQTIADSPEWFPQAFGNKDVTIYRVAP